jgi:hypothetical protein
VADADRRTPSRRFAVALAAVPLVALLIADGAVWLRNSTDDDPSARPATARHGETLTQAERADQVAAARTTAIRELLHRRADALLTRDRAAWRSTLDPTRPEFRRQQMRVFDNLREVPLRSWSYSFSSMRAQPTVGRSDRYGVESWAPATLRVHYRLKGFDRRSTSLWQYPTFVRRGDEWFIASFSDFAHDGRHTSRDVWDFGPVSVVRTDNVLVLGHPDQLVTMQGLAAEVEADIPRVNAVWGTDWAQRVVVIAPSTQHELSEVVNDFGNLSDIAAVATAEVTAGIGDPDPVGDRIGINPANWPKLSLLGRRIVITHELTHVASRGVTSGSTPKWLAEGFADYVGYLDSGVPTTFVAQDLRDDVVAGKVPRAFPSDAGFRGSSQRLSESYEASWLVCRLIADRWGQDALVRFYKEVGDSQERSAAALDAAADKVLHVSAHELLARWRSYLRSELA